MKWATRIDTRGGYDADGKEGGYDADGKYTRDTQWKACIINHLDCLCPILSLWLYHFSWSSLGMSSYPQPLVQGGSDAKIFKDKYGWSTLSGGNHIHRDMNIPPHKYPISFSFFPNGQRPSKTIAWTTCFDSLTSPRWTHISLAEIWCQWEDLRNGRITCSNSKVMKFYPSIYSEDSKRSI